ncbi:MAG: ABC transporter ATP-binding protein [bacterium]
MSPKDSMTEIDKITRKRDNLIKIKDLSFNIGNAMILEDISFFVHEGEYVSVIGPNGSGKTTLLKCMNRIYTAQKGNIIIDGISLKAYKQKDLAKLIGYVPQATNQAYPFTVYEFVLMGRYPYFSPFSPPNKEDRKAVMEALGLTNTGAFINRAMGTLSGGERQKIFIAAALAQGAKILLLDEPATFLDPRHQDDIQDILIRVNRESGVTIVAATHHINSALYASHRIIALKEGKILFCGIPDELINKGLLDRIYDKSFVFMKHPKTDKPVVL